MRASSSSKLIIVTLLSLTLIVQAGTVRAQQQQPAQQDQDEVINVDTALVQLHAVVTDRKGHIIDNLKQEDFAVSENGTPQEIKFFSLEKIQSRHANATTANAAPSVAPAAPVAPISPRALPARTVVLFVDTLHLSPVSLARAKQQLRQFVDEQLTDNDLVAIIVPTGSLGILQQFMRDRARLKYAIDKISPFQPTPSLFSPYLAAKVLSDDSKALNVAIQVLVGEGYMIASPESAASYARARAQQILGEEINFRRATLLTLKAVSERLASMKGQRIIAYISDGFTLADSGGGAERQDSTAATSRAVRAGVVIYTFNSKGLSAPVESQASTSLPMDSIDFIDYMNRSESDQKDILSVLADETGGRAYLNRNDLHNLLNDMLEENRAYYSLAYYPQDDKDKKKFRKIKVQIRNHPEYSVRVQNGYQPAVEQKTEVAATPQQALLQAMLAPLPATAIGVTATTNFLARADDDAQATLQIHIDGDSFQYPTHEQNHLLQCELAVVVLDSRGQIANSFSEQIKAVFTPAQLAAARRNGFRYDKRLNLKAGLYQVRVGVREESSGSMGTATSWLEVPDLGNRKLALSGLFFGQGRQKDAPAGTLAAGEKRGTQPKLMTGQIAFKNGDIVFYRFVVYNITPVDGLLKVEISQGDALVYAGDWQPLSSRIMRNDSKGIEAGGQFKATLPPGIYTLRVSVKDSHSKKLVQQMVDFEVSS